MDELAEIKKIFDVNVNCRITGIRKFGKRNVLGPQSCRTIIVNVSNPADEKIFLLSSRKFKGYQSVC